MELKSALRKTGQIQLKALTSPINTCDAATDYAQFSVCYIFKLWLHKTDSKIKFFIGLCNEKVYSGGEVNAVHLTDVEPASIWVVCVFVFSKEVQNIKN